MNGGGRYRFCRSGLCFRHEMPCIVLRFCYQMPGTSVSEAATPEIWGSDVGFCTSRRLYRTEHTRLRRVFLWVRLHHPNAGYRMQSISLNASSSAYCLALQLEAWSTFGLFFFTEACVWYWERGSAQPAYAMSGTGIGMHTASLCDVRY